MRRLRDDLNQTRILRREKSFWNGQVEKRSQDKRTYGYKKGQGLVPQHDFQAAPITLDKRFDPTVCFAGNPAIFLLISST